MQVNCNNKTFLILGLARSGTTILCNWFNSLDNGFCISEIARLLHQRNYKKCNYDKLGDLGLKEIKNIDSKFREEMDNSKYSLGGLKETYVPETREYIHKLINLQFDFYLFLYREPKSIQASRKRMGWKHTAEMTATQFNELWNLHQQLDNVYGCIYEDFCYYGEDYLKWILKDEASFDGQLIMKPSKFSLACPKGMKSTKIDEVNYDLSKLTLKDKEEIDNIAGETYLTVRDKFGYAKATS